MLNAYVSSARNREWPALLAIVGVFAAGWLLVGPRANVPVVDDWVYAWSVEHLVDTGRLQILDFSAVYPIAQILWGALFARVAGFSFAVLRLSTVVLAALGCWAVYLALREMGCRRGTSLLGALALALDPVYFALSFSFMTEVPFVSLSALALYCYVRATRRRARAPLWAGGVCATAAFLVRPIGIVLPLSMLAALIWSGDRRAAVRRSATPLVTTLVVIVALQTIMPLVLGPLEWAATRQGYLRWWFMVPITNYLRWTVEVLFVSVFPFTPLLLPYLARSRSVIAVGIAALMFAVVSHVALGELWMPLPNWQTWSLQDIAARAMIPGGLAPSNGSLRLVPVVKLLGLLAVASLGVITVRGWLRRPGWGKVELPIITFGVLHVAVIHALWLYNDRYYVVLAPAVAIIAAQALDADGRGKWLATALLAVWAGIAISGTRDMLAFNDACARAAQELEASGIPPWDIDAGYSLNGWRLYAHPENLPPGADRRYDVPFVTSETSPRYSIANAPLPQTDVIRVVPLEDASWQASRAVYVVRRQ